jgi:hypothetical protein
MRTGLSVVRLLAAACVLFLAEAADAACSYSVSPGSRSHGYGATNNFFTVVTSNGCAWTVTNVVPWITIVGGTNGSGSNQVNYTVAANGTIQARTGTVQVAGQSFVITQEGQPCNYTLLPGTRTHGVSGTVSNSFGVTAQAGCAWGVTNANGWITILGGTGGVGNGLVSYSVATNPYPLWRTGLIAVADEAFVMVQQPRTNCLFDLSPTNKNHGYAGSSGTVSVDTTPLCGWIVENTNSWVTITTNGSAVGSNSFSYLVATNPTAVARSGYLRIWDELYHVTQNPSACSFAVTQTTLTLPADQTTNAIQVGATIGCSWGVTNTNAWITILWPTNGVATGPGAVQLAVAGNDIAAARTGAVVMAGTTVLVAQAAGGCTYDVSPTNRPHGYGATTGSVSVATLNFCAWTVVNTNPWITLQTPQNNTGSSNVTYALPANTGPADRTGVLTIAGEPVTVTQRGVGCTVNASPTTRNHGYTVQTNTIDINVATGCTWTLVNTSAWLTIQGPATGVGTTSLTYTVTQNPTAQPRTAGIVVDEDLVTINQAGAPCSWSIVPTATLYAAPPATGTVALTTLIGCPWTVANTNPWITLLTTPDGSGPTNIQYALDTNINGVQRVGHLTIAGMTHTITQQTLTCTYKLSTTNRNHGHGATANNFGITTSNGCPWTVANTNPWITITNAPTGTGDGAVGYQLATNLDFTERIGTIQVSGSTFTITQAAYACNYRLSPTNRQHGFGSTTGVVDVMTGPGCGWTLGTTNDWITIQTPATGAGPGGVTYAIGANLNAAARTGYITLGGETLTLQQAGATNGFAFEYALLGAGGELTLRIAGGPAGIWELQASPDLANWTRVADLTNFTGRVEFTVPPPLTTNRYYRAILP